MSRNRSVLPLFLLGLFGGLCSGVPGAYLAFFGGDVGALVNTTRFRVFGHTTICDPNVQRQPNAGPTGLGPEQVCLPVALRLLDAGSPVSADSIEYRLFPALYVPEEALHEPPVRARLRSVIFEGEWIRRERVQ